MTEKVKLKSMDDFNYIQGLKVPVCFTHKQVKLVKLNSDASRRYYNKLVDSVRTSTIFITN